MSPRHLKSVALAISVLAGVCVAQPASAQLALTAAGTADGFSVSVFATLNPTYAGTFNFGPFGLAVAGNGNVLVSNYPDGTTYVFANTDGQTTSSALATASSSSGTYGYASAGGLVYGGSNGAFVQFNSNTGAVDHVLTGVTAAPYLGAVGDPLDGHIIATSYSGLIDIDPLANGGAGSFRVISSTVFGDGVSISPDGSTALVETGDGFTAYNIATGATEYTSSTILSADGTGVISSTNSLNGDVVVNTNDGNLYLYDPTASTSTLIATGGTRGDYSAPDASTGTLLLDYSDVVERLSCGAGCGVGSVAVAAVPEPQTYAMMFTGLGLLGWVARRRRVG